MASFDEPYLIASSSSSSAILPSQQSGSGFVWAQQKSGVHLTHTLHASTLASISVGPSFQLDAPPVSCITLAGEGRERWMAVIPRAQAPAPGGKKGSGKQQLPPSGGEIWTWHATTDKDGSFATEPPKKVHKTEKQPMLLCAIPDDRLFYLYPDGTLVYGQLTPDALTTKDSIQLPPSQGARFVVDLDKTPFIFALFSFTRPAEDVHFHLIKVTKYATFQVAATHILPHSEDIVDVSYSISRRQITTLHKSGAWRQYFLNHEGQLDLMRELQLSTSRFDLTGPATMQQQHSPTHLLPLHDNFFLLALPLKSDRSVLCTLWDLKHGVALAESTPSAAGRPTLALPHAGLAVALINNSTDTRIYCLPFTLPQTSTLSLVVGRAKQTEAQYLEQSPQIQAQKEAAREQMRQAFKSPVVKPLKAQLYEEQHEARKALLSQLTSPSSSSASASTSSSTKAGPSVNVDDVFGEYLSVERKRIKKATVELRESDKLWRQHRRRRLAEQEEMKRELAALNADTDDEMDGGDGENGEPKEPAKPEPEAQADPNAPGPEDQLTNEAGTRFILYGFDMSPPISMTFAKQLVDICLSSLKTSQKTLRYILERGVVSDDMAQPSVALSILQQGYKELAAIACYHSRDVTEDSMLQVYRLGRSLSNKPTTNGTATTETESEEPDWLRAFVERPSTPAALRAALSQLTSDEVQHVFESAVAWFTVIEDQRSDEMAFYARLSSFVSSVIDTHFVTILRNPRLSELLRQIQGLVTKQADLEQAYLKASAGLMMVQREAERAYKMANNPTERKMMRKAKKEMIEDYVLETFEV